MKFLLLTFSLLCAPAFAGPPSRAYRLVFSEDFTRLDRAKWATAMAAKMGDGTFKNVHRTRGNVYYKDENVGIVRDNLGNSYARLTTKKEETIVPWEGHKKYFFSAGILNSGGFFEPSGGYIEARIRTFGPGASGYITDFWLMHPDPTIWPPEIDILETAGSDWGGKAHAYLHWKDETAPEKRRNVGRSVSLNAAAWHTYAILWEKDKIQWFVDNVPVGEPFTTGVPSQKMLMLLSSEVGKNSYWGDPDAGLWPQTMDIDWVRVWENSSNEKS